LAANLREVVLWLDRALNCPLSLHCGTRSQVPTVNILGISAFYHDSAACLVCDGIIIAAAQEERFTRKKHDPGFPRHAIDYCLREAELSGGKQLDLVAFYEKPFLKCDRLVSTYLACAPFGLRSFLKLSRSG
jgi:carbamoyltransferase